jgi:elongation factor 3
MAGISNTMPDHVLSPSLPILAKPAADLDKVNQLLTTTVTTDNAQVSVNTAYDLTELLLNSVGPRGLVSYNLLEFIRKAAGDKKSPAKRQGAMFIIGALFECFPPQQPLSEMVFLVQHAQWLYMPLNALADRTGEREEYVRNAAQYPLDKLLEQLKAESLAVGLLPALMGYLSSKTSKWQGCVGAFAMIESMAGKAIKADDEGPILREALGKRLEALIPHVEAGMHDLKPEVGISVLSRCSLANPTSGREASPQNHEPTHKTLAK